MMEGKGRNVRALILQVRQAGAGGRAITAFTETEGVQTFFLSKSVLGQCGSGVIVPFGELELTARFQGDGAVITQYEGRILLDMLTMDYDDIRCWYYVVETTKMLFPLGEADRQVYHLLKAAALCGRVRNKKVTALMAVIQLLTLAGFDITHEETMVAHGLCGEDRTLLRLFASYTWGDDMKGSIKRTSWEAVCRYTECMTETYGEQPMKTAGAFTS